MRILAIDIGGTNTKVGIFEKENGFASGYPIIQKTSLPLEKFLKNIFKTHLKGIDKIGISIAANVNSEGIVINATNLELPKNFPLQRFVEEKTGKKCRVINDGTASAYAVLGMKEFKEYSNIVSVTLGTGIGGGIILNRKVLMTKTGLDSEIGHITVVKNGRKCNCGNYGCIEAYCGEKGIVERFNQLSEKKIKSTVELKKHLDKEDETAKRVITETGEFLGQAFSIITNILGIELFVLGGGVCGLGETLIETIKSYLRKNCFGSKLGIYPKVEVLKDFKFLSLKGAAEIWNE